MRRPAVAGMFYPGSERQLKAMLDGMAPKAAPQKYKAYGLVAPHAGYEYSGRVAAETYASIEPADTFIILGPNHHGFGSAVALSTEDWATPLGTVQADKDFIKLLTPGIIDFDEVAHSQEHSLEVQLPFIQYFFNGAKIVPVALGLQDYDTIREVAGELSDAIERYDKKVVVVASSDFTHYEDAEVARKKDSALIKAIEALDVPLFFDEVYRLRATCCGYGPIGAMMLIGKERGARQGTLIRYANSGDVTGDRRVVGYAGIIVH